MLRLICLNVWRGYVKLNLSAAHLKCHRPGGRRPGGHGVIRSNPPNTTPHHGDARMQNENFISISMKMSPHINLSSITFDTLAVRCRCHPPPRVTFCRSWPGPGPNRNRSGPSPGDITQRQKKGSIPLHDDTQKDNERNMSWHYNTTTTPTTTRASWKRNRAEKKRWQPWAQRENKMASQLLLSALL